MNDLISAFISGWIILLLVIGSIATLPFFHRWIKQAISLGVLTVAVMLGPGHLIAKYDRENPSPSKYQAATLRDVQQIVRHEVVKSQTETIDALSGAESIPYVPPQIVGDELWIRVNIKGKHGMTLAYVAAYDDGGNQLWRETKVMVPLDGFHVKTMGPITGAQVIRLRIHMAADTIVYTEDISFKNIGGNWESAWRVVTDKGKRVHGDVSAGFPLTKMGRPDW